MSERFSFPVFHPRIPLRPVQILTMGSTSVTVWHVSAAEVVLLVGHVDTPTPEKATLLRTQSGLLFRCRAHVDIRFPAPDQSFQTLMPAVPTRPGE